MRNFCFALACVFALAAAQPAQAGGKMGVGVGAGTPKGATNGGVSAPPRPRFGNDRSG